MGGFGIARFDIPMLTAEFKRADMAFSLEGRRVIDCLTIFHRMEPRNLGAAHKFYCGKPMSGAHRAEADTRASLDVFDGQLKKYPDLPKDIAGLSAFCAQRGGSSNVDSDGKFVWRNGKASFNFGKHRTKPLEEVARREPSYLEWLVRDSKCTPEMSKICSEALMGKLPVK